MGNVDRLSGIEVMEFVQNYIGIKTDENGVPEFRELSWWEFKHLLNTFCELEIGDEELHGNLVDYLIELLKKAEPEKQVKIINGCFKRFPKNETVSDRELKRKWKKRISEIESELIRSKYQFSFEEEEDSVKMPIPIIRQKEEEEEIKGENSNEIEKSAKPNGIDDRELNKVVHLKPLNRQVFIVHGHNGEMKYEVLRYLEKLDFEPIILHEQDDKGQTIIEKFENNSNVGFAVVLLSPDDVGAKKTDQENLKPRARQNVILEYGYFMGKMKRNKVCLLKKGDIEFPSDVFGVLYKEFDSAGGWKIQLANELKAAGYHVDKNKIR